MQRNICHCTAWMILILASAVSAQPAATPPDDFPRFIVPNHEQEMTSLRQMYWLHYQPPAGPLATLWDDWMTSPTLWPATTTGNRSNDLRAIWAKTLSGRILDPEGYVATHQHPSIAHQQGWPFPFWAQGGPGTWGWHFSLQNVPAGWHGTTEKTQEGWEILNAGKDLGIGDHAWNIEWTTPGGGVRTPPLLILPLQAPFMQLRWRADGLTDAQPYIEWTTADEPGFSPARRFYFAPAGKGPGMTTTMVPLFRSPQWKGRITRVGLNFDNPGPAIVGIQALFTQYDTRHNINNQCFVQGACKYFLWTGDLNFLRHNVQRMRLALRYAMEDLGGRREKCILAPFIGHDGRGGFTRNPDGAKTIHSGHGIGHNYWDIVPGGYRDTFGTIYYYDALRQLARLEQEIAAHPEWNIPAGPLTLDPDDLLAHAAEVKTFANANFWNEATGRFVLGLDPNGEFHDYGYTSVNMEAIYYDLATPEHAASIVAWLNGDRTVEGDTSQGADIYHWRFAPRCTTRRNIDWYGWYWSGPESIPFGFQVQDGGAVLGFSYHDLMSRLQVRGPDNAWQRLREILAWFDEVQAAGGYRAYYKDGTRGTMQGAGTAGGLGLDREFFESILVPQVVFDGFLGFRPRVDGFELNPRLPSDWPGLTVTRIRLQRQTLDVAVDGQTITISGIAASPWPLRLYLPEGRYEVSKIDADGSPAKRVGTFDGEKGVPLPPARQIVLKQIKP